MSDAQPVETFLITINDLPLQAALKELSLFADDATASAHGPDVESVEEQLNIKSGSVNKWCKDNHMVLGIDKTKSMLMGSQQKLRHIPNAENCLNIQVDGQNIEQVTSQKLLGVQIDSALNWDEQVKKVKKTANYKIYILRKIRKYLPLNSRKLFFNYYIKPHLTYCSSLWGQTTQENLSKINKIQKRAARLILDKNYLTPSSEMFSELEWQTFPDNVQYQQALLVYKSLNNQAPTYMREMFQSVRDTGR